MLKIYISNIRKMSDFDIFDIKVYKEDDGSFYAEVGNLPGCFSVGKTVEELEKNLEEAIQSYLLSLQKDLEKNHIKLKPNNLTYA